MSTAWDYALVLGILWLLFSVFCALVMTIRQEWPTIKRLLK